MLAGSAVFAACGGASVICIWGRCGCWDMYCLAQSASMVSFARLPLPRAFADRRGASMHCCASVRLSGGENTGRGVEAAARGGSLRGAGVLVVRALYALLALL